MKNRLPHSSKKSGFAIILSLSLMAFILLLLLSIVTLVRVETGSAEISKKQLQARQQALLGLQLALGELQQSMGPDQRVSATADIFNSADPTKKHFVGVWSSAEVEIGADKYERGEFLNWLSSDAKDANGLPAPRFLSEPSLEPDTPNAVTIVGEGSVEDLNANGLADERVVLDTTNTTVEENNSVVGRYAWWVGDEGVKARINTIRAERRETRTKVGTVLEINSPSVARPSMLTGLESINFEDDSGLIATLETLDLMSGASSEVSKGYFHDLTTYSTGVLSDVKNGGLRKDLSLAFEMDDSDFNNSEFGARGLSSLNAPGFGGVQPVFEFGEGAYDGSGTFSGTAKGPVWHLLRDYYRIYHDVDSPMTNPNLDARAFGPNNNHAETDLRSGSLSSSSHDIEDAPAILLAGGKAKTWNQTQTVWENMLFLDSASGRSLDDHPDQDSVYFDMGFSRDDPIRHGEGGDPLRGGGQTAGLATMPVMVTGNYLPYMLRFVGETGIYFDNTIPEPALDPDYIPLLSQIGVLQVNRERFVFHNPYNIAINHNDIGVDCEGLQLSFILVDGFDGAKPLEAFYSWNTNRRIVVAEDDLLQQRVQRYTRLAKGSFNPGEIKTFTSDTYHVNVPISYSDENSAPLWHHPKDPRISRGGDLLGYIGIPGSTLGPSHESGKPTAPAFYELYLFGNPGATRQRESRFGPWENDHRYSWMEFTLLTHMRPDGSSGGLGTDGIRDEWPMVSALETAFVLPGNEVVIRGASYDGGKTPSEASRFSGGVPIRIEIGTGTVSAHTSNAAGMQSAVRPIAAIDIQLKPAKYSRNESRYPAFARTNPLAPIRDSKNLLPPDDFIESSVGFPHLSPAYDINFVNLAVEGGVGIGAASLNYWGSSTGDFAGTSRGQSNPVLIELPTSPLLSLGKLQHANIGLHAHMPALAIGNSLASPYIASDHVYSVFPNRYLEDRVFYDLSYLMNEALWDSYFFSSYSIPYESDDYDADGRDVVEYFEDVFEVGNRDHLPNARMKLLLGNGETIESVKTKLFEGNEIRPESNPGATGDAAYQRVAENMLVEGSFNINSTSVDAWRAVLSGARDFPIHLSGDLNSVTPTSGNTPFPRVSQPVGGEATNAGTTQTWNGFRSLDDTQIEDLAKAIVAELKLRTAEKNQPFLSLGDFVNRELTSASNPASRTGLLQAAIDKSGINGDFYSDGSADVSESNLSDSTLGAFPHPENIQTADNRSSSGFASAPTHLMQADILQAIGAFISARSDTFRIRSYGETVDPITQKSDAKVWLEAIVQRVPEPAKPDAQYDRTEPEFWSGLDSAGEILPAGRKFKIISIRQLTEDEV